MEEKRLLVPVLAIMVLVGLISLGIPALRSGNLSGNLLGPFNEEQAPGGTESPEQYEQDTFVHKHAQLYFLINGERKEMTEAYLEQNHRAHFHNDDSIIHIEGPESNLSYVMSALDISVNTSCVTFNPDNTTYCGSEDKELRFMLGNETVQHSDWLNHTVEQGESIILYYGENPASIPERFFDPLPNQYSPGFDEL